MNRKYKLNKTPHQLWVDSQLWRAFKSRCATEGKSMSGKIIEPFNPPVVAIPKENFSRS